MFTLLVEDEVEREWREAVNWYDECEPGLGQRLNTEIRAMLDVISLQPERFSWTSHLTQKAKILEWPYSIYFVVDPKHSEIKVVAIWHGNRDPSRLARRLK